MSSLETTKDGVVLNPRKRKLDDDQPSSLSKKKKYSDTAQKSSPVGLILDGENYSCAYDALYVILYEIWSSDQRRWSERFNQMDSHFMTLLNTGFENYSSNRSSLENVRDNIRRELHTKYREKFPYGTTGTSVSALTHEMLFSNNCVAFSYPTCPNCEYEGEAIPDRLGYVLHAIGNIKSTASLLNSLSHEIHQECPNCEHDLIQPILYEDAPFILAFDISTSRIRLSREIKFTTGEQNIVLKLRGLIYHGGFHFISQVISNDDTVWFHDGMITKNKLEMVAQLDQMSSGSLLKCKGKKLVLALYAQI
jgi:hypothetical protein